MAEKRVFNSSVTLNNDSMDLYVLAKSYVCYPLDDSKDLKFSKKCTEGTRKSVLSNFKNKKIYYSGAAGCANTISFEPNKLNSSLNRSEQMRITKNLEALLDSNDEIIKMNMSTTSIDDDIIIKSNVSWAQGNKAPNPMLQIRTFSSDRFSAAVVILEKLLNNNSVFDVLKTRLLLKTFCVKLYDDGSTDLNVHILKGLFDKNLLVARDVKIMKRNSKDSSVVVTALIPDNIHIETRSWNFVNNLSQVFNVVVSIIGNVDPYIKKSELQEPSIPYISREMGTDLCLTCNAPSVDLELDCPGCSKLKDTNLTTPRKVFKLAPSFVQSPEVDVIHLPDVSLTPDNSIPINISDSQMSSIKTNVSDAAIVLATDNEALQSATDSGHAILCKNPFAILATIVSNVTEPLLDSTFEIVVDIPKSDDNNTNITVLPTTSEENDNKMMLNKKQKPQIKLVNKSPTRMANQSKDISGSSTNVSHWTSLDSSTAGCTDTGIKSKDDPKTPFVAPGRRNRPKTKL